MSASNAAAKKRRAMIPPSSTDFTPNVGGRPYISPKPAQVQPQQGAPPQLQGRPQYQSPQAQSQRTAPASAPTPATPSLVSTSQAQGYTLQQVISLIDKRLVTLENGLDTINNNLDSFTPSDNTFNPEEYPSIEYINEQEEFNKQTFQNINDTLNEYDSRFEILMNEILDIKTLLLKLQSYTMDVNKMLLEEKQSYIPSYENNGNSDGLENDLVLSDNYSMSDTDNTTYNFQPNNTDTVEESNGGNIENTGS